MQPIKESNNELLKWCVFVAPCENNICVFADLMDEKLLEKIPQIMTTEPEKIKGTNVFIRHTPVDRNLIKKGFFKIIKKRRFLDLIIGYETRIKLAIYICARWCIKMNKK